ncbi:S9 family peptidase [Porphyromonas cangingivalis]|uniref:Dipeptidyl-peptidase-4 n=1 Tax=Porphyromonas cangingivalis TaxID=36874 RepID=A0A1T4MH66_PORCN|nr:S9 family peptidase [Porphyromonas cangingivalis]SJZ66253.1 dipeptidyl-peptidase-4 [Porphyromonas cangingivalis]VEJ04216.1 Prolyl tripeptidyl peptidase precursor [Porphyromonas cangingivalis]
MNRLKYFLLAALLSSPVCVAQTTSAKTPTIKEITTGAFAARSAGNGFRSTADGKHYTILSEDHGAIVRYSYETAKVVDTLFNCKTARECDFESIDDYRISDNGHHIVLLRETKPIYRRSRSYTAYHYDVRRNMVKPLATTKGQVRIPTLSPNGRMCAYVIDNDIYIKKFDYDTEVRVTTDGKINAILNGVTDWVYEEELYTIGLMEWSRDGAFLAFVRSDESAVKTFDMTIFGRGNYPLNYVYKYPKAGEKNSDISLKLYNVDNRDTKEIRLPEKAEYYIPRLDFRGDALYVFTLNRHQSIFKVYSVNPKSFVAKLWLQDKDEKYIDTEWVRQLTFDNEGALYVNESDGTAQVYRYGKNGTLVGKVTKGKSDVAQLYGVTASGELIYSLASPTPADRVIIAQDKKGKQRFLSPKDGVSSVVFSKDMSYYLLAHSSATEVPRYEIRRTRDAKVVKLLEDNSKLSATLAQYKMPKKEFMTLKIADGTELSAWMIKPSNFDPSKRYPVVMTQYSGPGSQEVKNEYEADWTTAMAEEGFIVVCVDGRGTGFRGREFKKCTYLNLGITESNDQIAAAKALGKLSYIDGSRIGIFGWSFGGYNVLMCMSRGNGTFRAGVAVAPPSDWRLYDTIYTERYMRTPNENPEGYRQTSVLSHVDGLQGKLLIVHGTADDNVHIQNIMHLTEALIAADKDYDMMVYTDKDHGIRGGNTRNHLFRKVISYFKTHL